MKQNVKVSNFNDNKIAWFKWNFFPSAPDPNIIDRYKNEILLEQKRDGICGADCVV